MKDESPSSPLPLSPHGQFPLGLIAGLLLLTVTVLLPYALCRQPAWLDEAIFSYMAQGPSQAHLPYYQAGYDNKPPGIFLLYQALGAFDPAGLGRVRLAEGLLVLGTCLVLLFWLRREISPVAGWWAAFLYAFLMAFTPGGLALTEPPMAACAVAGFCLAFYGARSGRASLLVTAGLALGIAICFKQVAVFDLVALLAVVAVLGDRRGRRLLPAGAVLGGFLACWATVAVGMAATGQTRAFLDSAVLSLLHGGAAAGAGERLGNLLVYWRWILPMVQVPALLALLAFLRPLPRPLGALLGAWLVAAAAGVASSGYFLNHQSVQFFPALSALSGLGGAWLLQQQRGWRPRARNGAIAVLLLLAWGAPVDKYRIRLQQEAAGYREAGTSATERLGAWLAAEKPPGAGLYVLGNGMPLYFYSGRRAPTRYFHSLLLNTPELQEAALRDLQAHPPQTLVIAPDYYAVQRQFTARVRQALLGHYGRCFRYDDYPEGDPAFLEYEVWQWDPHPDWQ